MRYPDSDPHNLDPRLQQMQQQEARDQERQKKGPPPGPPPADTTQEKPKERPQKTRKKKTGKTEAPHKHAELTRGLDKDGRFHCRCGATRRLFQNWHMPESAQTPPTPPESTTAPTQTNLGEGLKQRAHQFLLQSVDAQADFHAFMSRALFAVAPDSPLTAKERDGVAHALTYLYQAQGSLRAFETAMSNAEKCLREPPDLPKKRDTPPDLPKAPPGALGALPSIAGIAGIMALAAAMASAGKASEGPTGKALQKSVKRTRTGRTSSRRAHRGARPQPATEL